MSIDPELRLLLEWESEAARWRRRAMFLLAVLLHGILALILAISPHLFHFSGTLLAANVEPQPRPQPTMLFLPRGLAEKLRRPPPTNILSDQNRHAQGPSPKVNPNGLQSPYMRGNTKVPELAGGGRHRPPSPPPSPPAAAPQQQAASKSPGPPKPPPPKEEAQLRLLDVPAASGGGKSGIRVPLATPGQAIQQSLQAAAQDRGNGTGASVGPGDSPDQFQNLNPNFSTSGPVILSDTRGVNFGPYLARVVYIVRRNWYAVIPESARLGEKGRVALVFEIVKDGSVPQLRLLASSGSEALDRAALASIKASNPFPPLPAEFTGKHLVLEFIYFYNMGTNY